MVSAQKKAEARKAVELHPWRLNAALCHVMIASLLTHLMVDSAHAELTVGFGLIGAYAGQCLAHVWRQTTAPAQFGPELDEIMSTATQLSFTRVLPDKLTQPYAAQRC